MVCYFVRIPRCRSREFDPRRSLNNPFNEGFAYERILLGFAKVNIFLIQTLAGAEFRTRFPDFFESGFAKFLNSLSCHVLDQLSDQFLDQVSNQFLDQVSYHFLDQVSAQFLVQDFASKLLRGDMLV